MAEKDYTHPDCVAFVLWARDAGYEPYHYKGRWWWEGPAITVEALGDVVGCPVKWQHDGMGKGYVVYPRESDKGE